MANEPWAERVLPMNFDLKSGSTSGFGASLTSSLELSESSSMAFNLPLGLAVGRCASSSPSSESSDESSLEDGSGGSGTRLFEGCGLAARACFAVAASASWLDLSFDPESLGLGLRARFEYDEVLEFPRDEVPDDFRRPIAGLFLLAAVLATTTEFLFPDLWMLSPDEDLPVFSLADRITVVEDLGIDTATSSLKRVVVDLRLEADLPDGVSVDSVGVGLSSKTTTSSFSAGGLDSIFRDDAGERAAILEDLPLEPETEPELESLNVGGGCVTRSLRERAARGLEGVGVTELASSSLVVGESPAPVGEVGACEAEEVGDVRERAAL